MRIELTDISPVKKKLKVELDAAAVEQETQQVVRRYAKQARVPGFRPGKAPPAEIRRRFAKEVQEDVRDRLLSRLYREATEEKGLDPIGDPVVEEISHEDGEPFRFSTTLEVLPEFTPKSYKDVEVRRQQVEVTDEDVDKALEEIRQSQAKLVAAEGREAETGDLLVVDLAGAPAGGEAFRRERAMLEIGATHNLPAFNEHLLGAKAGAKLEFGVDYPKEYPAAELAGKAVRYEIEVHEVKRREVPELDDELARDVGDFDDLAALKKQLREDLRKRAEAEARSALRQAVLDKVLLENPVPLPDVLVEREIRHRLEDLVRGMVVQGMDPREVDLDWKKLRESQEEPARKTVHAQLVLDAVAKAESVEVEKGEVDERIRLEAERVGETPQAIRSRLQKGGGLEALRNQLVREKSLDLLTSVANIQEEDS